MKIVSKYSDYYDCGVAYGIDENIYFERDIKLEDVFYRPSSYFKNEVSSYKAFRDSIYFCGKRYNFVVKVYTKDGKKIPVSEFSPELCNMKFYYTTEQYKKDFESNTIGTYWNKVNVDEYFKVQKVPDSEFIERGTPYYKEKNNTPLLKDYHFALAVDPMTAFQEISMYIAGVLNESKEECEIDEKYRIKGHGFNCESFRTRGKDKK